MSGYRFIATEAKNAGPSVAFQCQKLGVSRSGYYAWQTRPPAPRAVANAQLTSTIQQIHTQSHGTYRVPRVQAELREDHQVRCGRTRWSD